MGHNSYLSLSKRGSGMGIMRAGRLAVGMTGVSGVKMVWMDDLRHYLRAVACSISRRRWRWLVPWGDVSVCSLLCVGGYRFSCTPKARWSFDGRRVTCCSKFLFLIA